MSGTRAVRSYPRNVHFFNGSTGAPLGGLFQNGSVTQANFIDMLNIILVMVPHLSTVPCPFTVMTQSGQTISQTNQSLIPGNYDIYPPDEWLSKYRETNKQTKRLTWIDSIELSDEPLVRRLPSHSVSGREAEFTRAVRARDGKCVISGTVNRTRDYDIWEAFEVAHIFPPEKGSLWVAENFGRWIANAESGNHSASINSAQNGLLLRADILKSFDAYSISVNPDVSERHRYTTDLVLICLKDNYKITAFSPDNLGVDGKILDPVCRNPTDPSRASDHLLRWHFRQTVLSKMRGAGEPSWEHDFPPGSDMLKEILEGPLPIERFELELSSRLRGWEGTQDLVQ